MHRRRPRKAIPKRSPQAYINVPRQLAPSPPLPPKYGPSCQIIYDGREPGLPESDAIRHELMTNLKEAREPNLHLRFHTTPTADTRGTSLTLEFQGCRYLIGNAHEGLARSFSIAKNSLSNVNNVILAGKTQWEQQGGLVGLILTLADARAAAVHDAKLRGEAEPQRPRVKFFGGRNLTYVLATTRKFVFRQDCAMDVHEQRDDSPAAASDKPTWCDENVQVWPLQIKQEPLRKEPASVLNGHVDGAQSNIPSTTGDVPVVQGEQGVVEAQASSSGDSVDSSDADVSKSPRPTQFRDDQEVVEAQASSSGDSADSSDADVSESPRLTPDQDDQEVMMLKSILSQMFESDWRLDALFEVPLSEADLSGAIFMKDAETGEITRYTGPEPGTKLPPSDTTVWVRKPWPGAQMKELPKPRKSTAAMSYIIKDYPQRGKIDGDKLKAFGVQGKLAGDLSQGKSVTNAEGKIVTPEDVTGPEMPACGFAFVDLPDVDYVANLIGRPEWQNQDIMTGLSAIVWNLGQDVSKSSQLQAFVRAHPHLTHVVASPHHQPNAFGFEAASVMHIARSQLDPDRYSLPAYNDWAQPLPDAFSTAAVAIPGLKVNLRKKPRVEAGYFLKPSKLLRTVIHNISPALLDNARTVKEEVLGAEVQQEIQAQKLPSPDTEIIALGTGAARPSKYRGLSGTLVRVPGIGSYLLDCGENTLGQLGRVYAPAELTEVLRDLRMVFISHMHADHHLGLTSVIRAWNRAMRNDPRNRKRPPSAQKEDAPFDPIQASREGPRLVIASEPSMIEWLREYAAVERIGIWNLILLTAEDNTSVAPPVTRLRWNDVPVGFGTADAALNAALRTVTGLQRLQVAKVSHCAGAHGCTLTFAGGLRVTYSGDCRPSRRLVEVGRGSTLLIHEATFDDLAAAHALEKKHSTVSEALGVADAMGAQRLLLTHVSARYDRGFPLPPTGFLETTLEDAAADKADQPMTDGTVGAPAGGPPLEGGPRAELQQGRFFEPSFAGARPAPARRALRSGLKVGLLSDYMRVRLRDILLLEKFAPVMDRLHEQKVAALTRPLPASPKRERSAAASPPPPAAKAAPPAKVAKPRTPARKTSPVPLVKSAERKTRRSLEEIRSWRRSRSPPPVEALSADAARALAGRLEPAEPAAFAEAGGLTSGYFESAQQGAAQPDKAQESRPE